MLNSVICLKVTGREINLISANTKSIVHSFGKDFHLHTCASHEPKLELIRKSINLWRQNNSNYKKQKQQILNLQVTQFKLHLYPKINKNEIIMIEKRIEVRTSRNLEWNLAMASGRVYSLLYQKTLNRTLHWDCYTKPTAEIIGKWKTSRTSYANKINKTVMLQTRPRSQLSRVNDCFSFVAHRENEYKPLRQQQALSLNFTFLQYLLSLKGGQ